MMDNFVLLPNEEKRAYFETAAEKLRLIPELVEKDFWVCWILRELFSLKDIGEHLIFKGGTSLSKVYRAIRRFSEDVDISIERSYLGYGGVNEPDAGKSNKEKNRRIKELQQSCQNIITDILLPELINAIKGKLKSINKWTIKIDPADPDKQTLLFQFPNALTSSLDTYVKPTVKIELGARSDHWPVEIANINPYISDVIPKAITNPITSLRTLVAKRTFWEKATILHQLYHYPTEKQIPPRMSRHYYDTYAMSQTSILDQALNDIDLLISVAEHKKLFFRSASAKYEEAKPGTLRLSPHLKQISEIKNDYQKMKPMFFEQPPLFDDIIYCLKEIEFKINLINS